MGVTRYKSTTVVGQPATTEVVVMGERMKSRTPLSVRIPDELTRRLDRLIPKIAKDQNVSTMGRVSRSAVVKLALLRGVAALEQEYK